MGNLFNVENGFFTFMGKVWDMILLSILWVICSIPIVTIGPASAALYYAVVKVIRRERGYITREFFHSFKDNLKVGCLSTLAFLVLGIILFYDYQYANQLKADGVSYAFAFNAGFNAVTLIAVCTLAYVFPVLSRFTLGVKSLLKTAFFMSVRHFLTTIIVLIILVATALVLYIVLPAIFFMPSICALLCSFLLERVFKKYMPAPEEGTEESSDDQWYLE